MNRQDMVEAGVHGLAEYWKYDWDDLSEDSRARYGEWVRTVLDAVLPEITDATQMLSVPEGSLVITQTHPNATVYMWRGGELTEPDYGITYDPDGVIGDEGPLTVVWRP